MIPRPVARSVLQEGRDKPERSTFDRSPGRRLAETLLTEVGPTRMRIACTSRESFRVRALSPPWVTQFGVETLDASGIMQEDGPQGRRLRPLPSDPSLRTNWRRRVPCLTEEARHRDVRSQTRSCSNGGTVRLIMKRVGMPACGVYESQALARGSRLLPFLLSF
ncbi:hypothetical protein MRX96_035736 [Rhipicephalus microplus]